MKKRQSSSENRRLIHRRLPPLGTGESANRGNGEPGKRKIGDRGTWRQGDTGNRRDGAGNFEVRMSKVEMGITMSDAAVKRRIGEPGNRGQGDAETRRHGDKEMGSGADNFEVRMSKVEMGYALFPRLTFSLLPRSHPIITQHVITSYPSLSPLSVPASGGKPVQPLRHENR